MAKSKKSKKVDEVTEHENVVAVRTVVTAVEGLETPNQEKFEPQLAAVAKRLTAIADKMQKTITLEATKDVRAAAKREKLLAKAAEIQKQLEELGKK